jgi:hypothetical protein
LGGRFHVQHLRLAVLAGTAGAIAVVAMAASAFTSPARDGIALLEPIAQAVSYRLAASSIFVAASDSVVLHAGDAVRTDASGRAYITYADGTTLVVEPNSDLVIDMSVNEDNLFALITQNAGRVWYQISRTLSPGARYEVRSGSLAAVVRAGSTVSVDVTDEGTNITTVEGSVDTTSGGETVTITAGNGTTVASGTAPSAVAPATATPPTVSPVAYQPPSTVAPVPTMPLPTIPAPAPTPTPVANGSPTPTPKQHVDPQPSNGNDDQHGHKP